MRKTVVGLEFDKVGIVVVVVVAGLDQAGVEVVVVVVGLDQVGRAGTSRSTLANQQSRNFGRFAALCVNQLPL